MLKRFWLILSLAIGIALLAVLPALAESVDTAWVRRYNGSANGNDIAYAIGVDTSGNVYVTGTTLSSGTYVDYTTIKYKPNGDTAWVREYNGPVDSTDQAFALAINDSGHVFVTGGIYVSGTNADYATIKYYPNGGTGWVRTYNGPGDSTDGALAIAVDDSGNVYVTGWSDGIGTETDYATIKYCPNGDTAWVRRYNGPGDTTDAVFAIAVDCSSYVFVTGFSYGIGTERDYATIKYKPNGDTAWVRRYNGADEEDIPYAIALDDSGNVIVTGASFEEGIGWYCVTIKYHPDGDTAWVRKYLRGGSGGADKTHKIAVDGSNNVYVTGGSYSSETNDDYTTIKYYPNGDTAWVRKYDGPGHADDWAQAIAVDTSNNVYVTGRSDGGGTGDDYATIKYYSNGDLAWVIRYDGPGNMSDVADAIAVDDSGNVYVTGYSHGTSQANSNDYATIKYVPIDTDVKDETGDREKPSEFVLSQNSPNPFNQFTKIEFTLAKSGFVSLNIFDILGRKVRTLVSERLSSGYKSVLWDGKNDSGKDVASGIYFYNMRVGEFTETKKLALLK